MLQARDRLPGNGVSASIPRHKQAQPEDQGLGAKNRSVGSVGSRPTEPTKSTEPGALTGI
jgi:hypothetical protein